ncbi:MAG: hypothetical protein QNK37_33370 [Acidobacteriota bacterium]|nr:hypothetical protein [Acidobacteriota bacterium]
MSAPRYIQVIRLLKPGELITFRNAALIANQHFDWYKSYASPVKEMEKMLRSSLKKHSSAVVEKVDGKQYINSSNAIIHANTKYPTHYYGDVTRRVGNKQTFFKKHFLTIQVGLLFVFISSFCFLVFKQPSKDSMSIAEKLFNNGDVEGLLLLNRTTTETQTMIHLSDELGALIDDTKLDFVAETSLEIHPIRDEIAHLISELSPSYLPVNSINIIGVFPYLNEPMWIITHDESYLSIKMGSRVVTESGSAGTVVQIDQYKLTLLNSSGGVHQYHRPRLSYFGIFPESAGPKSIIYPQSGRGNWESLAEFLELGINPGAGNVYGAFPPWQDLDDLRQILEEEPFRLYPQFYDSTINFKVPIGELLERLLENYPDNYAINIGDRADDIVWYRGETLPSLFDFLGLTMVSTDTILEVWDYNPEEER